MVDNQTTNTRSSSEPPSSAGLIALFVVQVFLSAAALLLAVGNGMAADSCGPVKTTECDYGLAEASGVFTIVVIVVALFGAAGWAAESRARGHRGIWGPLGGSILVLLGIVVNMVMNVVAIPGLLGL
jgi:hypothetical protein